jgi:hypothetical protein
MSTRQACPPEPEGRRMEIADRIGMVIGGEPAEEAIGALVDVLMAAVATTAPDHASARAEIASIAAQLTQKFEQSWVAYAEQRSATLSGQPMGRA